ncbi:MAG: GNAT family N-acetyltransferase [Pseudomonadota bacterium]
MSRVIVPSASNADRLSAIAAAAFDGDGAGWAAADFLALAEAPGTLLVTDAQFRDALLVLRVAADEAEILEFGVIPSARRAGLGRQLLATAEALAARRGAKTMFLEVAVDNAAALALYQSTGWAEAGLRRGYYQRDGGAPVDALIMRRTLVAPAER